jgi:hypothetical protein
MTLGLTVKTVFARLTENELMLKIAKAQEARTDFISVEVQGPEVNGSCTTQYTSTNINYNHIVYYQE